VTQKATCSGLCLRLRCELSATAACGNDRAYCHDPSTVYNILASCTLGGSRSAIMAVRRMHAGRSVGRRCTQMALEAHSTVFSRHTYQLTTCLRLYIYTPAVLPVTDTTSHGQANYSVIMPSQQAASFLYSAVHLFIYWHCPHSIRSSVYVRVYVTYVVRPSVCSSMDPQQQTRCCCGSGRQNY